MTVASPHDALVMIAYGARTDRDKGGSRRLTRADMIALATQVCVMQGWHFDRTTAAEAAARADTEVAP